jgi:hypothetical protein
MTDRGIIVTKVVAFLFTPVGILLLAIAGYVGNRQYNILKSWPTVEAQVTRTEVVQGRDDEGNALYGVNLEFMYTVNEKKYLTPGSSSYRSSSRKSMQEKSNTYAVGTRHPIRYDPNDPGEMRFDVGYNFGFFFVPFLLGVMGIVFTAFGVGFLYTSRSEKPLLCPSCGQEITRGQNFCANCAAQLPGSDKRAA